MGFDVWLENRTPFSATTHVQLAADGQEVLLALVSASFVSTDFDARLEVAPAQLPVHLADVPAGDPAFSSTLHEADVVVHKPVSEVLVLGEAFAPEGAASVEVGLEAGDVSKRLVVSGDRLRVAGGWSPAQPFERMPITWERAYGGTIEDGRCERRNPVGIGYLGARSADPSVLSEAPNIAPAHGATDVPVGFGPVGRGWLPRLPLAGTYDDAWLTRQWPLPPHDFDPSYNLCAPEDQRSFSLQAHAPVTLTHMTPGGGVWRFRLPQITCPMSLIYRDRIEVREVVPDTIILEPSLGRVSLKARAAVTLERNAPKLLEIVLGHVSPVWLNARRQGKGYLNPLGGDGTLKGEPLWAA